MPQTSGSCCRSYTTTSVPGSTHAHRDQRSTGSTTCAPPQGASIGPLDIRVRHTSHWNAASRSTCDRAEKAFFERELVVAARSVRHMRSRSTSGRRRSRCSAAPAPRGAPPRRTLRASTPTSPPGCPGAAGDRGSSRRPAGCSRGPTLRHARRVGRGPVLLLDNRVTPCTSVHNTYGARTRTPTLSKRA